jgi:4-hydroxybenzoate polyprenyltransferase
MSNWLKPLDYFFLTRPILFFPGWATLLAGYAAANGHTQFVSSLVQHNFYLEWWQPTLILGLLLFACAMGGSFVLNQLQDIESDKSNNKLFLLGDGFIAERAGYIESWLLLLMSLLGSIFITPAFFLMVALFNLVTGYMYNFAPFHLKNKPVGGLFANMAMGWLAFALGWTITQPINLELLLISLPYLFFNTALYFLTTLPDVDGDRASDKITFPVKYGLNFTVALCLIFFILAGLLSLWHKNEYMLVVIILSAPFMLRMLWHRTKTAAIVAVKIGIASFALLMCAHFPLFLVLLALIFFFTRFYYKNRFNFDYPNFKGR